MALESKHVQKLAEIVGSKEVLTSKEDLIPYSFDGTAAMKCYPGAVAFVSNTSEVSQILSYADSNQLKVVTRGSGTGLSGGSIPSEHCIVLCTTKMDQILEVDSQNLTMLVEPGVITKEISDVATKHGLFYPPDPGSMKISTIGGNVAENSGGLRGLKYGVTRNYIMGLEMVLPNGDVMWTGNKCVKDVAGYSIKDLIIGSEGTLGIITKVLLKLIPKPQTKSTMVATFDQMDKAAQAVSDIIAAQIIPCTLEFLDRTTIHCVEDFAKIGLPLDCESLLLMETDGHPAVVKEESEKMVAICEKLGCKEIRIAKDAEEADKLASARRTAFSALARMAPTTILEDATVPRSHLAEMVRFVNEIAEKYKLNIGTFGHMGDGNLHPTFLTDENNKPEMERVHKAFTEIFEEAIRLGGTITGEHGIGLAKKEFLPEFAGKPQMDLLKAVRKSMDPNQTLNPGKIFDL